MRFPIIVAFLLCFSLGASAQQGFSWVELKSENKIELRFNGSLVTAYCYFDSTEKPVLFPVKTLSGITVTRGFPVHPRPGERTDHPHHVGLWFNYESVNGLDFWNNSYAIPKEKKHLYGSIRHQKVISKNAKEREASLKTLSHWVDHEGHVLLEETTVFTFGVSGGDLVIDRKCTLMSKVDEIAFKDVKDGMLGIRVARELEMPSTQADKFVDIHGNETTTKVMDNTGVTGMYYNREGIKGDDTWSKRSSWTYLEGVKDNENIAIVILDHPSNPGYPTYWHARGYGLFAANPLGQEVFSNGKEKFNLRLKKGEKISFQYRVIIHSGSKLTHANVDEWMTMFHQTK